MINLSPCNTLAIGLYTQSLNNRGGDHYCNITVSINTTRRWKLTQAIQKVKSFFLVGYEDFLDISIQSNNCFSVDTNMDTAKVRTWYAPKTYFLLRTKHRENILKRIPILKHLYKVARGYKAIKNLLHGVFSQTGFCQSIKRENADFAPSIKRDYFFAGLANFSRQVAITQAEKLVFSFFACSSICSIRSWGKRIAFVSDLLLILPVAILKPLFIVLVQYTVKKAIINILTCYYTLLYSVITPFKLGNINEQCPEVLPTLSRHLTQPLTGVMIMANRYDSAPLRAEQSKLFKSRKKDLRNINYSGYIDSALAKSKVGCGSLNQVADMCRYILRFFCVRVTPIFSMVGRSDGAEKLAGFYLTSLPTSLRLTAQCGSCSVRFNKLQVEAVTMTTIPNLALSTQKLFKFYDISLAQVVKTIALNEQQAMTQLGKSSLIFVARIPVAKLLSGVAYV